MPTYRGNRGNLLQHWVLAELIALLDRDDRATRLTFIDAHAMSPCALRCERPSQSSIDFDVVISRLPGQGSTYEQAWLSLKAGRCEYPSSSALVQHLWGGQLELILCEADETTANEIVEWHNTLHATPLDLHIGDWRSRFDRGFESQGDAVFISFDPDMFNRNGSTSPRNMTPNDIHRIAHSVMGFGDAETVLQLSTYSANDRNNQDDVIRSIEPILSAQGLELSSVVRADGNMMSMVFSRNVPHLRDAQLQERFDQWLKSATNLVDNSTEAGNRPAPSPAAEYSSGGAKTTKVGYINRNQQRCMGHRGVPGTDHGQLAYGMECLKCGHIYGANGTDIFQRKCPECGGAKPGIPF